MLEWIWCPWMVVRTMAVNQSRINLKFLILLGAFVALIILSLKLGSSLNNMKLESNSVSNDLGQNVKAKLFQDGERSTGGRMPMVLSINYWEQFGNALKNFFDLQCWAKSVNICCVVEPSISLNSEERVFQFGQVDSHLTLGNIISMTSWNDFSHYSNYSIVVSMAYFLKYACRRVVYVKLEFRTGSFQCRTLYKVENAGLFKILHKEGFSVETVCINTKSPTFSHEELAEQIFKKYKGQDVTVMFDEWRGISPTNEKRLYLPGSRCQHCLKNLIMPELSTLPPKKIEYPRPFVTPLYPSDDVLEVVNKFMKQYVGQARVVAIIVRTEKLRNTSQECAEAILSDHQLAKTKIKAHSTLIFKDFGELGSVTFTRSHRDAVNLIETLEKWIEPNISAWKVDQVIAGLSRSRNKVFLGMVVGTLVASADCVQLVGGGAFHSNILNMYAHRHRGRECIYYRGAYCHRQYISQFNSL